VDPAAEWVPGIRPLYPEVPIQGQIPVETMEEIEAQLWEIVCLDLSPRLRPDSFCQKPVGCEKAEVV